MSRQQLEEKKIIGLKKIQYDTHTVETPVNFEKELEYALKNLESLKLEQERIRKETESEIEQARATWAQEKEVLVRQAKEEGFQAGFQQGESESKNQYQHLIDEAKSIIVSAKKDYQEIVGKNEETILTLGIKVAEKILNQELSEKRQSFVPIVKAALLTIKDQQEIAIYVHPSYYEDLLLQKVDLERIIDQRAELSIYINENLELGSCLIEHPFGKVDASISTQLEQIHEVLQEMLQEQK